MTEWQPIETAPKDGKHVLFGGRWKPFDISKGGQWEAQIFSWSTVFSDGTGYEWIGAGFGKLSGWNVDWTHWMPLPAPPGEEKKDEAGQVGDAIGSVIGDIISRAFSEQPKGNA